MKKFLITTAMTAFMFGGAALAEIPADKTYHTPPQVEAVLAKLPKEKADLFRTTMEGLKSDREASRAESKKLHDELEAILTAPTFDKAAFLAKSKEIAAHRDAKRAKFEEAIASIAGQYTQEERKMLVDAMPKRGMHHGWHKKGDAPAGGPVAAPDAGDE
ncbi:MAG: periplasmic heavy metal sensor [Rickettsiales bacterium]